MHVYPRRLRAGEAITNVPGENVMVSCNGRYRLALNADGNLVRPPGRPRVVSIDVSMIGQCVFVSGLRTRGYITHHQVLFSNTSNCPGHGLHKMCEVRANSDDNVM